jgi:hypothetical protein
VYYKDYLPVFRIAFIFIQTKTLYMEQSNTPLFGLTIEGQTAATISSSVQWGRILAICGIIFGGFFILVGILLTTFLSRAGGMGGLESDASFRSSMALGAGVGMVMYILMGGLTILGNVFLLNYANKVGAALKTNDAALLNSGFAGLRNYFAFWGVIMMICLLLMVLGVLSGSMM